MVFVFLFAIVNVKSFALPTENIEYDTLPDYTDEETYFGKLKKLSSDTLCEPKITYKSYWAPWQGEIKQDFPSKEYVLYQCDYYFDAPISVEETPRRLYPGEQIRHTDVFSYDSKETMKSISETSLSIFSEFSREKKIGFSLSVKIVHSL